MREMVSFKCSGGHSSEMFVTADCVAASCPKCGEEATKVLSADEAAIKQLREEAAASKVELMGMLQEATQAPEALLEAASTNTMPEEERAVAVIEEAPRVLDIDVDFDNRLIMQMDDGTVHTSESPINVVRGQTGSTGAKGERGTDGTQGIPGADLLPLANTWDELNTFTLGLTSPTDITSTAGNGIFYGAQGNTANLAMGAGALALTTGGQNVGIGSNAGTNISSGESNLAIGASALLLITTGVGNVGVGQGAMFLATGSQNVAIGRVAGQNLGSGDNNPVIGCGMTAAQMDNTVLIGAGATERLKITSNAVVMGNNAGQSSSSNSVAIGNSAGKSSQGSSSLAIGTSAGQNSQGVYSIAIGRGAAKDNQGDHSIVINASGGTLNDATDGNIHIASDEGSIDFTAAGGWTITDAAVTEVLFTKEALQAVAAAATDFADFQTRIAAL
jgi:hypothetical protein